MGITPDSIALVLNGKLCFLLFCLYHCSANRISADDPSNPIPGKLRTSAARMFPTSLGTNQAQTRGGPTRDTRNLFLFHNNAQTLSYTSSESMGDMGSTPPSMSPSIVSSMPSDVPSFFPTKAPTVSPTKAPTVSPTESPSNLPTMMPTELKGIQKWSRAPTVIRWALLIPFFSIGFILWAARSDRGGSRSCVKRLMDHPIPDEITVPSKGDHPSPDVELVSASTWKTHETWDGMDGDIISPTSTKGSAEDSDISTDFVAMK